MLKKTAQNVKKDVLARYAKITRLGKKHDARAKKYLPGGDTREASYYPPYPAYMDRGKGCYLYDCDGNRYIDFLNNYTSLIHGHAHPEIVKAAQSRLKKGTVLCSPAVETYEHARMLCRRLKSAEMVRYGNSGTEATLFAIRAARAFTGKDLIIKMDGGYHGSHDSVEINVSPDFPKKGLPKKHLEGPGIPKSILKDVLIAPFNDLNAMETLMKKNQDKIAGVILEPLVGRLGMIPPDPGYLKGLRALCDKYDILLIFDEVITFRLDPGGYQATAGVTPDLTALGKIIGGGFAIGAFGGRKEIMAPFDPMFPERDRHIGHSGTFNGNNITMAAGLAAMRLYDRKEVARINRLGDRLREGFNKAFEDTGISGQCTGFGSLLIVVWAPDTISSAGNLGSVMQGMRDLPMLLHLDLMTRGVFSAPRGLFAVSTPMTGKEIDRTIARFAASLSTLKPYVVEETPYLTV